MADVAEPTVAPGLAQSDGVDGEAQPVTELRGRYVDRVGVVAGMDMLGDLG